MRPQLWWISDLTGSNGCDKIVRFENLEKEMQEILSRLGFSDARIPHLLDAKSDKKIEANYSPQGVKIVAETYAEEISYFQYNYDPKD